MITPGGPIEPGGKAAEAAAAGGVKVTAAVSSAFATALSNLKKSYDASMSSTIYNVAKNLLAKYQKDPLKLETIIHNATQIKGQTFKNDEEIAKALLTPLKKTAVVIEKGKEVPVKTHLRSIKDTQKEIASAHQKIINDADKASQTQYEFDRSRKTIHYLLVRMDEPDMSSSAAV